MEIKNWKEYVESISGWELVGKDMGPNYPQSKLPNTLSNKDTSILMGIDGEFYTESDFMELFDNLSKTNKLNFELKEFNKSNLDNLLQIKMGIV
jgi:hypothetical protein